MAINFGAKAARKRAREAFSDIIGAQQQRAGRERRPAFGGCDARRGEQRDRRSGDDVGPFVLEPLGERERIERRGRSSRLGAEPAERNGKGVGDAADLATGKCDRDAVAGAG